MGTFSFFRGRYGCIAALVTISPRYVAGLFQYGENELVPAKAKRRPEKKIKELGEWNRILQRSQPFGRLIAYCCKVVVRCSTAPVM